MHLRLISIISALVLLSFGPVLAQGDASSIGDGGIDFDILLNYYDQDGEHSPVTGGIGTEQLDVISPVFLVNWRKNDRWTLKAELGLDAITSASTDNMDLGEVVFSSASRVDERAYTSVTAVRNLAKQDFGFTVGFSNEYDYQSVRAGLNWSRDFRQQQTTLAAGLQHFADTIDLYGIDGIRRGDDSRSTTDLSLSVTQVLGRRTVGSVELFISDQSGFLSTPFHEVILAPTPEFPEGQRVAERLPDSRTRTALGLRLNHAFSKRFVQRVYYRYYDDDWGGTASTVELEPHFRLSTKPEMWVYPILRYHTQTSSDYFGLPNEFSQADSFITADRELSEFTSEKYGLGWRIALAAGRDGWLNKLRTFETRLTTYSRDDGLDSISASFAFGWRFK